MLKIILLILSLASFIGCTNKNRQQEKATIKIIVEIIPESDSSYSISWNDTLGQSEGHTLTNRPLELWCILKDSRDTVGYYTGLSTASNFTHFSTNDSIITAIFKIGQNTFSSINSRQDEYRTIEFNPIMLNMSTDLRKRLEIILKEK